MAITADGIMVSGGGEICMIEFDTLRFSPGDMLITDAKKKIADTGLNVGLDCTRFDGGILTLIIGEVKSVGDTIINIIRYIVGRIKASAPAI